MEIDNQRRRVMLVGAAALTGVPAIGQSRASSTPVFDDNAAAIADGFLHRLAERFDSLPSAQQVFPAARSLDQSIAGLLIQQQLDEAERTRGTVSLAPGRYVLSEPLRLPSFVHLRGPGAVLDNQNVPLAAPLIVNKDATNLIHSGVHDLAIRGGTHGLRLQVKGEVAGLRFDDVTFELQTVANLTCNQLFQTTDFNRCTFDGAPSGVDLPGIASNALSFRQCQFTNHSDTHLRVSRSQCVSVSGGRFEGGGRLGEQATIELDQVSGAVFDGVYFEATHRTLLRERRANGTTRFANCQFTGAGPRAPFVPYEFVSDGMISFGSNGWTTTSGGPPVMLVAGSNYGALRGDQTIRFSVYNQDSWRCAGKVQPDGHVATLRLRAGSRVQAAGTLRLLPDGESSPVTIFEQSGILSVVVTGLSVMSESLTDGDARLMIRTQPRAGQSWLLELDGADLDGLYINSR